jgi:hypothetical protein
LGWLYLPSVGFGIGGPIALVPGSACLRPSASTSAAPPRRLAPAPGGVEIHWPEGHLPDRVELLQSLGLLQPTGDDGYQLADR